MNCRPTDHGWLIEYTDDEERLKEFIRTANRKCGGLTKSKEQDEYRKEILWLIQNKPTKTGVRKRGLEALKETNEARLHADANMLYVMYSENALKDFYAELDKFGSRGCL